MSSTPELRAAVERLTRITAGEGLYQIYGEILKVRDDITTVLSALAEMEKPDIRWCPIDAEYSTEDLEEELDNACYDRGKHVVEVACAKRLPHEYYIWDTDYERDSEQNKLIGPFKTEAEAKAAIAAADAADREGK